MTRSAVTLLRLHLLLGLAGCCAPFDPDPSTDISPTALRSRYSSRATSATPRSLQPRVGLGRELSYDKQLAMGDNASSNFSPLLNSYEMDGRSVSTGLLAIRCNLPTSSLCSQPLPVQLPRARAGPVLIPYNHPLPLTILEDHRADDVRKTVTTDAYWT
jgi:hypothetical protein